jgi:hypothetical protein
MMATPDLSLVSLRNNILLDVKRQAYKVKILDRIKELGLDISKYAHDQEFILLVCNIIEHLVKKSDNIPKRDLAIEIFAELFDPITEVHKQILESSIDFLHKNGNIRKVSAYKLFRVGIKELFKIFR